MMTERGCIIIKENGSMVIFNNDEGFLQSLRILDSKGSTLTSGDTYQRREISYVTLGGHVAQSWLGPWGEVHGGLGP